MARLRRTRNQRRLADLHALRRKRKEQRAAQGTVRLDAAQAELSGRLIAVAQGISKSYGGRPVVRDFSARIMRGDRVGIVGPNGLQSALPNSVRVILKLLVDTFTALEAQIAALDAEINQRSKSAPTARRLMTIPGVGPIASTAITALVPAAEGFPAGRDFAAWLGLTPLQKSTGGKQKLGAVSKR